MTGSPPPLGRVIAAVALIAAGVPLLLWSMLPVLAALVLGPVGMAGQADGVWLVAAQMAGIGLLLALAGLGLVGLGLRLSVGRWRLTLPLGLALGAVAAVLV